jgi:hypothetical protein
MLRLMFVAQRLPCIVLALAVAAATSACGSQVRSGLAVAPSASPSAAALPPGTVPVVLLHCGMQPVTAAGRVWVAPPQAVDGDPELPLDATNRPDDWVGYGTVAVVNDRMTYTDAGGEVVEFVPEDHSSPPPGCA